MQCALHGLCAVCIAWGVCSVHGIGCMECALHGVCASVHCMGCVQSAWDVCSVHGVCAVCIAWGVCSVHGVYAVCIAWGAARNTLLAAPLPFSFLGLG